MDYIKGTSRNQLVLFQETLDSVIPEDHLVRFIDMYVDKLNLFKLEINNISRVIGCPGYNPTLYLKIYIYSYLNKIRSSRKIETECKRNMELIWLTQQLSPDHWSISNFRKLNKKALTNIFKEFLRFCNQLNLLSMECIAIDGTKIRGQNNISNVYKNQEIDKIMETVDNKISLYIEELELNDKKEQTDFDFLSKNIPDKLNRLKKHKDKLKIVKEIFKNNPELEKHFANDSDSNFQKDNGRCVVGYNCQSAVDEKNKLIISTDVTNENNDAHQLVNMKNKTNKAKKDLNINNKSIIVLDAGYHSEMEIIETLKDENIDLYIPHPRDVKNQVKYKNRKSDTLPTKGYKKEDFSFDSENNTFICPEKQVLKQRGKLRLKHGIETITYRCTKCLNCKKKHLCTTSKDGRRIEATINHQNMKTFREKGNSPNGKKIISKRKELVEHPFGSIKRNFGFTYFMQTGLEAVKSEFSFIAFIYNFKRVTNTLGIKQLIKALN